MHIRIASVSIRWGNQLCLIERAIPEDLQVGTHVGDSGKVRDCEVAVDEAQRRHTLHARTEVVSDPGRDGTAADGRDGFQVRGAAEDGFQHAEDEKRGFVVFLAAVVGWVELVAWFARYGQVLQGREGDVVREVCAVWQAVVVLDVEVFEGVTGHSKEHIGQDSVCDAVRSLCPEYAVVVGCSLVRAWTSSPGFEGHAAGGVGGNNEFRRWPHGVGAFCVAGDEVDLVGGYAAVADAAEEYFSNQAAKIGTVGGRLVLLGEMANKLVELRVVEVHDVERGVHHMSCKVVQ